MDKEYNLEENPFLVFTEPRQLAREREDPPPPSLRQMSNNTWLYYYTWASAELDLLYFGGVTPWPPTPEDIEELAQWKFEWEWVGNMDRIKERRKSGPQNWKQIRK